MAEFPGHNTSEGASPAVGEILRTPDAFGGCDLSGIMARHEAPLLRYVGQLLGRAEDAQDVVQETFLRYCRYSRSAGSPAVDNLQAWLFSVAHNLAQDVLRRQQRERQAHRELRDAPPELPEREAVDQVIRQAASERALAELRRLPEDVRHVLLLKVVQDMSFRDIAKVTGLSYGNVAYRVNQGLKELSRRLREAGVL